MTPDATFEGLVEQLFDALWSCGDTGYAEDYARDIAREHANAIRAAVAEEIAQAIEVYAGPLCFVVGEEARMADAHFRSAAAVARRVGGKR